MDLYEERKKKIRKMSGGMKQRLRLAGALMGEPAVLILDEPTAGLDPEQRREVGKMLKRRAHGRIILVATHVVSDIEAIADQVLILNHGRVAYCGRKEELIMEQGEEGLAAGRHSVEDAYLHFIHMEDPHGTL